MAEQTLDAAPEDRAPPAAPLSAGTTLGHFRVIRELGAGGMGRVFEAHDPDLDRRVAIKVVRDADAGPPARERMLREAQAMARLAHPNVVAIHEVGTLGAQLFLVMEYVRGETLADWLGAPRTWRQIVEAFAQAGDGLAAAHAAGLVHRDFKPHNVMRDDAGRVRVTDFGLAHLAHATATLALGSPAPPLAGTPAYIAPEQRLGDPVDARADQYAFAVSLRQALANVGGTPRRVRAAIARGLAVAPADRFPTIEAFVAELRAALGRRRRVVFAAIVGAALAGGAGVAWSVASPPERTCATGAVLVERVWNANAAREVAAALREAHGAPPAIATATRLVDDWVGGWRLGRAAACEAPPAQRTPRLACLDRALGGLQAQLAVWRTADAAVGERVVAAAAQLPDVAACIEPAPRAVAPALIAQIAELRALVRSGRAVAARDRMPAMVAAAEAAADPATLADALIAAAEIARDLGDHATARAHLARAAKSAGTARDQHVLTQALVGAAKIATEQGRPLDGLGLLDAAAAIAAAGHYDRADRIAYARGVALAEAGKADEAIAELERAIALFEARATRDRAARIELAAALVWLASAHDRNFRFDRALPLAERALAIEEADLGPTHPSVGETLHTIGNVTMRLERYDAAAQAYARARAIFVAAYGDRHETVGSTDVQLATLALQQGKHAEARTYYERALHGLVTLPSDHPTIAAIEAGLGSIERELDRCAQALPHFDRAIAIIERAGHGGTELAVQLTNRGACALYTDRLPDARAALARAEALFVEAQVEPAELSEVWLLQAELAATTGDRPAAIALAEKMLAATRDDDRAAIAALRAYAREQLATWRAGRR